MSVHQEKPPKANRETHQPGARHDQGHHHQDHDGYATAPARTVKDPVCGMGVDPHTVIYDRQNRPFHLVDGSSVGDLLG